MKAISLILLFNFIILGINPSPAFATDSNVEVKKIVDDFFTSWNAHDGKAIAAHFDTTADFINVIGMHWVGRSEIEKEHIMLHNGRMKATHLEKINTKFRYLTPSVVIAIVKWHLIGDKGAPGWKETDNRTGYLTYILQKKNKDWLIIAAQNTDIIPIPNN